MQPKTGKRGSDWHWKRRDKYCNRNRPNGVSGRREVGDALKRYVVDLLDCHGIAEDVTSVSIAMAELWRGDDHARWGFTPSAAKVRRWRMIAADRTAPSPTEAFAA